MSEELIVLPDGWEAIQFEPLEPTGTYAEFKRELLNEVARALGVPNDRRNQPKGDRS